MQRKLRQGFGRYRMAVLEVLPKTRLSDNHEDVEEFIRAKKGPDYFLP